MHFIFSFLLFTIIIQFSLPAAIIIRIECFLHEMESAYAAVLCALNKIHIFFDNL